MDKLDIVALTSLAQHFQECKAKHHFLAVREDGVHIFGEDMDALLELNLHQKVEVTYNDTGMSWPIQVEVTIDNVKLFALFNFEELAACSFPMRSDVEFPPELMAEYDKWARTHD